MAVVLMLADSRIALINLEVIPRIIRTTPAVTRYLDKAPAVFRHMDKAPAVIKHMDKAPAVIKHMENATTEEDIKGVREVAIAAVTGDKGAGRADIEIGF